MGQDKASLKRQESPLISVVIVNWNGKRWLDKLLASVFSQTYKNYEVIFVDNASTDDSVEYIKKHFPETRIIKRDSNGGFAAGNNTGIEAAQGAWILMLNTDTWIEPNFLEKLYEFAQTTGYDIVGPKEAPYENGETRPAYVTTIDPMGHPVTRYGDHYGPKNSVYLSGVCALFKKELYFETGGMDENFFMYFEEIDWFWRMILLGKSFGQDSSLEVHHAGAGSGQTGLSYRNFLWRNENTLQMLLKNYSAYSLIIIIPLYIVQNILEMLVLALIGKGQIAKSYYEGWKFNLNHLSRTLKERQKVQAMRVYSDISVLRRMYLGPGKLQHLMQFLRTKRKINA